MLFTNPCITKLNFYECIQPTLGLDAEVAFHPPVPFHFTGGYSDLAPPGHELVFQQILLFSKGVNVQDMITPPTFLPHGHFS
jgi:hypothetical protein